MTGDTYSYIMGELIIDSSLVPSFTSELSQLTLLQG